MASEERRLGTFRRGMTVLGRIPTPSVPKPINVPNQRSADRDLHSKEEVTCRGVCSWETTSVSNAKGVFKAGASGSMSLHPTCSGAWNGGIKNLSLCNNEETLAGGNHQPLLTGTERSCTATVASTILWSQEHEQVQSSLLRTDPVPPCLPENSPQHNGIVSRRAFCPNGAGQNLESCSPLGTRSNVGAGPAFNSCPEGVQYPGDAHIRSDGMRSPGMLSADDKPPAGKAPHADHFFHKLSFGSFGASCYSGPLNREILSLGTTNKPSQLEKYQPQPRNVDHFTFSGDHAMMAQFGSSDKKLGSSNGKKSLLQERQGFDESVQHLNTNIDLQLLKRDGDHYYSCLHKDAGINAQGVMSAQGNEWVGKISGPFMSSNDSAGAECVRQNLLDNLDMNQPGKRIILLTKLPPSEPQQPKRLSSDSTLQSDCGESMCRFEGQMDLSNFNGNSQDTEQSILGKPTGIQMSHVILEKTKDSGTNVTGVAVENRDLSFNNAHYNCFEDEHLTQKMGSMSFSEVMVANDASGTLETREVDGTNVTGTSCENRDFSTFQSTDGVNEERLTQTTDSNDLFLSNGRPSSFVPVASTVFMKGSSSNNRSQEDHKVNPKAQSKYARQSSQVATFSCLEPVGIDSDCSCEASFKQKGTGNVVHKGQKMKIKSVNNPKTERAWRPKSTLLNFGQTAGALSSTVAHGKKSSEAVYKKATGRDEVLQACTIGDVIEESASLQISQAHKVQRIHRLSSPVSSSIFSEKDDCSPPVTYICKQSKRIRGAKDKCTESQKETDTLKYSKFEACPSSVAVNDQQSKIEESPINQLTNCQEKGYVSEVMPFAHSFNTPCMQQSLTAEESTFSKIGGPLRNKASSGQGSNLIDKGKCFRSHVAEAGVSSAEANSRLLSSQVDSKKVKDESKIVEQEGALESYDYVGQCARLKEMATQRAKQRRKEEEERIRNQKAKALAKLEELDRRTKVVTVQEKVSDDSCNNFDGPPSNFAEDNEGREVQELGLGRYMCSENYGTRNDKPTKFGRHQRQKGGIFHHNRQMTSNLKRLSEGNVHVT